MRRRLALAAVALTTTIVLAFCIPLARLVGEIARDQAIGAAERDAERLSGAVAVTTDTEVLTAMLDGTASGGEDRLGVVLPDGATVGVIEGNDDEIVLARDAESAFTVDVGDDLLLLAPIELVDGVAVVVVRIPASDLERGVAEARAILAVVAAVLLISGVALADRLASSITRPAIALADASRRVADGDLTVRVTPSGPPELAGAARGFNDLAGRLTDLIADERQAVADLAHRLRTPLSAMQLDVEAVDDADARERLSGDVVALERAVDTVIREARRPIRQAVSPVSDLAEVTRDRVAFWSALADEQRRPWSADVATTGLPVAVSREELEAVVDALLDNVFTHTPSGTAFEVSADCVDSSRARLVVRDHGPGIGPSRPPADASPGQTGLGLDIVSRAVQAGGGTFEVDGDGGVVVTVELPLVRPQAAGPPADRRRPHVPQRTLIERPS